MNKSRTGRETNLITIERLPQIRQAAVVLRKLEERGLVEPAIASGWTRGFLTGVPPSDIDVAYVGSVSYVEARQHLRDVLSELGLDAEPWDIEGIWNAQATYGVAHTAENYLLYYVDSIDSVYLAADGRLHDPTGFGLADAEQKVLRLNDYDQIGRTPTAKEEVYICLEGCRRIAKFGWTPTLSSVNRMALGLGRWDELSEPDQDYYFHKLRKKYQLSELATVRPVYERFGWHKVFDLAMTV